MNTPNKTLHLTAIALRSIAAGELGRYMAWPKNLKNSAPRKFYNSTAYCILRSAYCFLLAACCLVLTV
jgi:hypothetical protein